MKPKLENQSSSVLAWAWSSAVRARSSRLTRSFDDVLAPPRSSLVCVQNEVAQDAGSFLDVEDAGLQVSSCIPSGWPALPSCPEVVSWLAAPADRLPCWCCWRFNFFRSSWRRPVSLFNSSAGNWLANRRSSSAWIRLPPVVVVLGAQPRRWSSSVRRSERIGSSC